MKNVISHGNNLLESGIVLFLYFVPDSVQYCVVLTALVYIEWASPEGTAAIS